MEESREQRIAALEERIFLLQINERRYYAIMTSPSRNEEMKAQAKKAFKESRDLLIASTKELNSLKSESWKAS